MDGSVVRLTLSRARFCYWLAAEDRNQDSISAKSASDRTTPTARAASPRCGDRRAGPVATAVTSPLEGLLNRCVVVGRVGEEEFDSLDAKSVKTA